jgi:Protein of unknown function (DUF2612)
MTGPPVPASPVAGSNQIGDFTIGVSPIGTISPFVFWTTVISQYANSPRLMTLIQNFDSYIDQTQNFDSFYDLVWNVATAQGYGLDVWGRIVGVNRVIQLTATATYFGFEEAGTGNSNSNPWGPGGTGVWYSGVPNTSNYALSDTAFRTLIYAKALSNISDGSIKSINQILVTLFPGQGGNAYVTDGENMTMQYVFNWALTPVQLAIVSQTGVLPKPVGVAASIVVNG